MLDTCCGLGYTAIAAARKAVGRPIKLNEPRGEEGSGSRRASETVIVAGNNNVPGNADSKESVGSTGSVTTIEYDMASLEMCAHNPWSRPLFDGSLPITVWHGDSCQGIRTFPDRSFNVVIHDPPARALCRTDLYSVEFYNELYRVLTRNGVLYHYIGNPDSKESGRLYSGIVSRLASAGFMRIERVPKAFGVVAYVS